LYFAKKECYLICEELQLLILETSDLFLGDDRLTCWLECLSVEQTLTILKS